MKYLKQLYICLEIYLRIIVRLHIQEKIRNRKFSLHCVKNPDRKMVNSFFAHSILLHDRDLIKSASRYALHGEPRKMNLMLKTILEDVAGAYSILISEKVFNGSDKVNIKKSLNIFQEETGGPLLEYQADTFHKLYGHFNRFSHFNSKELVSHFEAKKDGVVCVVARYGSFESRLLFLLDVYIHLEQMYWFVNDMIVSIHKDNLKYVKKDENDNWKLVVPRQTVKRIFRFARWGGFGIKIDRHLIDKWAKEEVK